MFGDAHPYSQFLQIFPDHLKFKHLATHKFALWTESSVHRYHATYIPDLILRYEGHYGPVLAHYILDQNQAIRNHTITGILIKLEVLGIGDGITVRCPRP